MDRQTLLEQKRQRLQELKQRRLGNFNKDEKVVNELIDQFQNSTDETINKQVNVAIQVDFVPQEEQGDSISKDVTGAVREFHLEDKQSMAMTYEKAVQTVDEQSNLESDNSEVSLVGEAETDDDSNKYLEDKEEEEVEEIEESKLNSLMKDSFKFLNKILTQEAVDSHILKDFSKGFGLENVINNQDNEKIAGTEPFKLSLEITSIKGRSIRCIDVSPHSDELIIASYSLTTLHTKKNMPIEPNFAETIQSPGLAVIYNIKNSKAFPEFFLHCTSEITEIIFDKLHPDRVIGGLVDGKVVIWSLSDNRSNSVAVLPLLMSPVLSNIASSIVKKDKQMVDFIHHTNEISSINQVFVENNHCIVSTSLDGVINLWSSNLLAWPMISSLRLYKPSAGSEGYINKSNTINISKVLMSGKESDLSRTSEHSTQLPAYKFLNKLVVGTEEGKLFRLSNQANNGNIKFIHEEYQGEEFLHSSRITSIIELQIEGKDTFMVTSSLDWNIKIWKSSQTSPIAQIPVNYLILDMKAHPSNSLQFVTVGMFNQSLNQDLSPIIEFWDLGSRLMNPIYSITLPKSESDTVSSRLYATRASFDADGSHMIIGFNDGTALVWSIDHTIMKEVIKQNASSDFDDGLAGILLRNQ